jgi:hypothetical protein
LPCLRAALLVLLVLFPLACERTAPPPTTPVDVHVDFVVGKSIEPLPVARSCTAFLKAERITKSMPGCYLDEHVSRAIGTLNVPCEGDGTAEATFADHRYVGRLEGHTLTLALDTELDWNDGCRWATHHVIRGTISRSGVDIKDAVLSWRYADNPLRHREEDCSGSCTAQTRIALSSVRPTDDRMEEEEEEVDVDP